MYINLNVLSTKEDITELKLEIGSIKLEVANNNTDILKWMIGMFVPLYLTIIGLIIALLLKD